MNQLLKAIPGVALKEMARNRGESWCCGAGGGWMWMDEKIGKRINIERLEDALASNCQGVATACPFCISTLEDAIKVLDIEEKIEVKDISEILKETI